MAASGTPSGTSSVGYNSVADSLVQFSSGLDTNTDPFVLQPPYTTTATDLFYLSPGQIQALPLVAKSFADTNSLAPVSTVFTAGSLSTFDPHTTGSTYEIAEVPRVDPTGSSSAKLAPAMLIRDWTNNDPKGPLTPLYPYNTETRSIIGNLDTYVDGATIMVNPVSASSKLDPTRVLTVWRGASGIALATLTDATGATIAQNALAVPLPQSTGVSYDYRLIADNANAGYFYLVGSNSPPGSLNVGLVYAVLKVPTSTDTSSTIAITTQGSGFIFAPDGAGGSVSIYGWDLQFWNNLPYLFAVAANGAVPVIYYQQLLPTLTGNFFLITQITVTGLTLTNSNSFSVASSTNTGSTAGLNWLIFGMIGSVYSIQCTGNTLTGTLTQVTLPNSARSVTAIARPLPGAPTDYNQFNAAIFCHVTESFTNPAGYPAGTYVVQQIAVTYMHRTSTVTTPTIECTNNYRSIQGAVIVAKAWAFNSIDGGITPVGQLDETFACPILIGPTDFNGYYNGSQCFFVLDQFARVVSRFNEEATPQNFTTNALLTTSFPVINGLSMPVWFTSPNDSNLWTVATPYIYPIIEQTYQATAAPTTGNSLVYFQNRIVNGGLINFFLMSQQAQGAVAPPVQIGKSTLLSGGLTMEYDTRELHESGFHVPAKPIGPVTFTGTGGTFTSGVTGSYYVVYTWTDATGLRHMSAPSLARLATYSGNTSVTFFVQAPPHTYKNNGTVSFSPLTTGIAVQAEIYRNGINPSDTSGILYYLGTVTMPNNQNAAISGTNNFGATFTDTNAGNLTPAFTIYTQGGKEYESDAPPPFIWQVNSKGRAFGLACVGGTYRIYFSSVYSDTNAVTVQAEAPRFNGNGYVTAPQELGDIRSLAVLDDKIIVMGTRALGVFSGDGPALTLASGQVEMLATDLNYSAVLPIPATAGVVGCGSPYTTFKGVVYQDRQGMSLMDRSLTTSFVGKNIADTTNTQRFGIPQSFPNLQFVLFPNAQGPSLVMDYNSGYWSQWLSCGNITAAFLRADGTGFVNSGTINTTTAMLTNTGTAQIYPSGNVTPVTPIANSNMVVETPWLQIGQGISGEGDMWDMVLLGKYIQPHTLLVETAFNYGAYTQQTTFQPGIDATVPTLPYQYRFRPLQMARMQAVRYRITVTNAATGATQCECARITGIMLYSGNYRGLQRTGAVASR